MRLIESDKVGIRVTPIPERSGEVIVSDERMKKPENWICVIPDLKVRDIFWLSTQVQYFDKFAPSKGDGILVRKDLLLDSKLLTRRQIFDINNGIAQ